MLTNISWQWLLNLPFLASVMGMLARLLVLCLGKRLLCTLVKLLARMPDDAASVTADFLASKQGVQQAL